VIIEIVKQHEGARCVVGALPADGSKHPFPRVHVHLQLSDRRRAAVRCFPIIGACPADCQEKCFPVRPAARCDAPKENGTDIAAIDPQEIEKRKDRVRKAWRRARVDRVPLGFVLEDFHGHTLRQACEDGGLQLMFDNGESAEQTIAFIASRSTASGLKREALQG
jgi:hypothetical protein